MPSGGQAIHLTRLRYLDREPLLAESIWSLATRFQALLAIPLPSFGDLLYPLYEDCCHQVVASARESLTAEAIAAPYAGLLQLAPGTPAIVLERLAKAYDSDPLGGAACAAAPTNSVTRRTSADSTPRAPWQWRAPRIDNKQNHKGQHHVALV